MKRILIVSGSRADLGLLHCPEKALREDGFNVLLMFLHGATFQDAFAHAVSIIPQYELMLILGDRFEILAAATAAHLQRIPIAHIGGGDVTEGSYDDAMRDCISRMSSIHFATSFASAARLISKGYSSVHLVGNPDVDYIMHEKWQRDREIAEPYVVVSYQPETIDGTTEWDKVLEAINGRRAIAVPPNPDRGSGGLHLQMILDQKLWPNLSVWESQSHDAFLNLLFHCDEFIGNSSAIFYEAPFLKPGGVKCKLIGKRQRGRVVPWGGDGKASERIRDILRLL